MVKKRIYPITYTTEQAKPNEELNQDILICILFFPPPLAFWLF